MPSKHPQYSLRAAILLAALLPLACDQSDPIGTTAPPVEVFEFDIFAVYVPATVSVPRGVILALGGPDTRGFVTGKPMGAPAAVEPSLQMLGQALRNLAAASGLAVLGTSRVGMPNGPDSDQLLQAALDTAAARSGRRELSTVPLLMYGMSGGSRQASGFTVRNPERVAGLLLKVPAGVSSVTSGAALRVPTYMITAALDAIVDTAALRAAFEANRGAGALWALAKEPDVIHHSLSEIQRQVTVNWISTILALRLPATRSDPLRETDETAGWLGNRVTAEVAPWAAYAGDRASANWFPSQATATEWTTFVYAIDYSEIHGVYDVTALITDWKSSLGDLFGYRYTAEFTLWPEPDPRRPFAGTYAGLRLIGPGGDTVVVEDSGSVTASVGSYVDYRDQLVDQLVIKLVGNENRSGLDLIVFTRPSGFIYGGFIYGFVRGDFGGGPFTATRRSP